MGLLNCTEPAYPQSQGEVIKWGWDQSDSDSIWIEDLRRPDRTKKDLGCDKITHCDLILYPEPKKPSDVKLTYMPVAKFDKRPKNPFLAHFFRTVKLNLNFLSKLLGQKSLYISKP